MEQTVRTPAQWLRYLLYLQFGAFALGLIAWLMPADTWNTWAQRILDAGSIYCLFRLAARYRSTAVLHAVTLGASLLSALLSALWLWQMRQTSSIPDSTVYSVVSGALTIVIMVVSWVAIWQLCHAHGDLVPEMANKWRMLFFLQLLAALMLSGGSAVLAALRTDDLVSRELYGILGNALYIPARAVDVLSMLYLVRTIHILEKKEE